MANDSAVQTEIGYTGLANPFQVQYCGHHKLCARSGNNVAIACQLTSQPVSQTCVCLPGALTARLLAKQLSESHYLNTIWCNCCHNGHHRRQSCSRPCMHRLSNCTGLCLHLIFMDNTVWGLKLCVYTDKLVRSVLFYSKQNDSRKNGNIPLVPNR